jgi:hypothetical protein
MQRRALGAQAAEIRRVRGVAAHAGDAVALGLDEDAATDAAITADGRSRGHDFFKSNTCATRINIYVYEIYGEK